jgi:hypothetical protein
MIMDMFHENVNDDFVEYFLHDLLDSMIQFNDMLVVLTKETNDKSRNAVFKRIDNLKEIINEEVQMLKDLRVFRKLTYAEVEVVNKIADLRESTYIMEYEKTRI